MDVNFTLGFSYCILGILVALLCKPLMDRKVEPNRWYGFRYRASYASKDNWYRINEYGARCLFPWALLILVAGLVPLAYAIENPGGTLLCGCLPWLPLVFLIPALQSWLFARKLGRDAAADDEHHPPGRHRLSGT